VEDLDGYLERIGLGGTGRSGLTLAQVHRAHTLAIPFENLDPVRGVPVSLDPATVEAKLVAARRGGYCFEQNTLLAAAITALGLGEVAYVLARVRMGDRGVVRPQSHLLLRVTDDAGVWHADVGFGGETLPVPIAFAAGAEVTHDGWRYRTVDDGPERVLQAWRDGAWFDFYGFEPRTAAFIDLEVANWYAGTSPRSPFTAGMRVGRQERDRRWTMGGRGPDDLILGERTPEGYEERPVAPAEVPALLAEPFGLPGAPRPGWLT
jgi:N-hydroxyarylamine O-acetyltransferase